MNAYGNMVELHSISIHEMVLLSSSYNCCRLSSIYEFEIDKNVLLYLY